MIYLPDTNTILRYLLADNPVQFETAFELFEKIREGDERAIILESVIVECIYVLVKFYKIPRHIAAEKLKAFLSYRGICNTDRDLLVKALKLFSEKNLDIVDCILFEKSGDENFILFTFEEKLLKLKQRRS
jgi:predicted nucleic-acid-binding protein